MIFCVGGYIVQPLSCCILLLYLHTIALWNLATMATKVIKCPLPVFPIPYGCWCGITLSKDPGDPIDDFDAACMVHDHCYDRLEEDKKCSNNINEYTANYKWHVDQDFKVIVNFLKIF